MQSLAQDGSDILYAKEDILNDSLIGKHIHVDFGRDSGIAYRFSLDKKGSRHLDILYITVNGKTLSFQEHREDNGFNNWFHRQHLKGVSKLRNSFAKIPYFIIDKVTTDSLHVQGFIEYSFNGSPIDTITPFRHVFSRKNIREILFDAKGFKKN